MILLLKLSLKSLLRLLHLALALADVIYIALVDLQELVHLFLHHVKSGAALVRHESGRKHLLALSFKLKCTVTTDHLSVIVADVVGCPHSFLDS